MDWSNFNPSMIPVFALLIPIVAIAGHFWYESIKVKAESELKRTMVEQGRSAEEIERVLGMRSGKGSRKTPVG